MRTKKPRPPKLQVRYSSSTPCERVDGRVGGDMSIVAPINRATAPEAVKIGHSINTYLRNVHAGQLPEF